MYSCRDECVMRTHARDDKLILLCGTVNGRPLFPGRGESLSKPPNSRETDVCGRFQTIITVSFISHSLLMVSDGLINRAFPHS